MVGRGEEFSLSRDERANLSEAALADAGDDEEVFCFAEGAVALAVLDDARGNRRADARQALKLFARGAVDGNGRGRMRRRSTLLACERGAAGQFDARRREGEDE